MGTSMNNNRMMYRNAQTGTAIRSSFCNTAEMPGMHDTLRYADFIVDDERFGFLDERYYYGFRIWERP